MKMKWTDLAKDKMRELGISQEKLGELIGKTQGAVGHWLNGRREPSIDDIAQIMKALKMPEMVLLSDGYVRSIGDEEGDNVSYVGPFTPTKKLPLISWVSAGQWSEALEPYKIDDIEEWPETTVHCSDGSFWLKVRGDSMTSPTGLSIPEGMIILIDPEVEPSNGKLVVAKLENENEATFKRYVTDAGQKYLKPLNPQYAMIQINGNCTIIGVVVDAKVDNLP
nr:LexA family transcriptional regulator [Sodalis praecaptivus]